MPRRSQRLATSDPLNAAAAAREEPLIEQDMENFRCDEAQRRGRLLAHESDRQALIEKKIPGCIINIASMASYVPP